MRIKVPDPDNYGVFKYMEVNTQETPYPSIYELLPPKILNKLPTKLAADITERYATLGEKYLTDVLHSDGRRINGMMFTDRLVNCNEEIIDAVFCIVGQIFKDEKAGKLPSENLEYILDGLMEMYTMISLEIDLKDYT